MIMMPVPGSIGIVDFKWIVMKFRFIGILVFLCFLLPMAAGGASRDSMPFLSGELELQFLADNAVRLRYGVPAVSDTLPEWVYVTPASEVRIEKSVSGDIVSLSTGRISVEVNPVDGTIRMIDGKSGDCLFESAGISLTPAGVDGASASLRWKNIPGEHLYGLGQFQDGYVDVRGLTRRLTQVNTQISIPMVISDKGYGILWNNYGLTDFNPCGDSVRLDRAAAGGDVQEVFVTTTEGGATERREKNEFSGKITVDRDGTYALMLDVGQKMARRHNLVVNGDTVVDMTNIWLPPVTSVNVWLKKGDNIVSAELEKDDRPVLYYREVDPVATVFQSPVAENVDFTLFAGNADDVVSAYREATGGSPMMPLWALGYIHCRERFHSQDELLSVATEFRKRHIPVDMIVQDWQYWGKYGWNAMRFDEKFYPDPKLMTDSLHAMDMRFMLSVWSKIDPASEVGKEALDSGYMIPGTQWIDFFNDDASRFYWRNFSSRLLPLGIDAWWQDATEPENDDLLSRRVMNGRYPGELFRNVYPLLVNRTVYEGCRTDDPSRRTMILTRCGFPGIQRYGAAMWSGDVGHDWKTLRYQLASGLGMMAAGMPWWTYDAGGFFRPWNQHKDDAYRELLTRWVQISAFLPLMRVHGYMSDTEPWLYGDDTGRRITDAVKCRYRMLPYIYSVARKVSAGGYTLMRPLFFDFPGDTAAADGALNYMFGDALLVVPVLQPSVSSIEVRLPAVTGGWYDFNSGIHYAGDEAIDCPVSLDGIPVFVKAGSVLPLSAADAESTPRLASDLDINIYGGADGSFILYEDDGVTYDYEKGASSEIEFTWDDSKRELTVDAVKGGFPGMAESRIFNIRHSDGTMKKIVYNGTRQKVQFEI